MAVEYDLNLPTDPKNFDLEKLPKIEKSLDQRGRYDSLFKLFKYMPRIEFEEQMRKIIPVPKLEEKFGKVVLLAINGMEEIRNATGPEDVTVNTVAGEKFLRHTYYNVLVNGDSVIYYVSFYNIFKKANTSSMIENGFSDSEAWENEKLRRRYVAKAEADLLKSGF